MRRPFLLLPLLALAAGPAPREAPLPPEDSAPDAGACDALTLCLLADAAAARRNVVFSPFSLSGALGMAALGARGETLAQIDRVAGTGLDPAALAERAAGARAAILDAANADGVELMLADSLWKRANVSPLPAFEQALRKGFGAEIREFGPHPASEVNRWVSEKTKGRIPSLFDDVPPEARLALVDAVYFKAQWAVPFERNKTSVRTFFPEEGATQSVPFMNLLSSFSYEASPRWESLEIPYVGRRFRMQIVLPRPGTTLSSLVEDWRSGVEPPPGSPSRRDDLSWPAYLELSLPKFSFEAAPDVDDALRRLGATDLFDPQRADFSGMVPPSDAPLALQRLSHRAVIEVDERGTTASAATGGIMIGCAAQVTPERFVVDRPFAFFIRGPEGRILFAGALFDAAAATH